MGASGSGPVSEMCPALRCRPRGLLVTIAGRTAGDNPQLTPDGGDKIEPRLGRPRSADARDQNRFAEEAPEPESDPVA